MVNRIPPKTLTDSQGRPQRGDSEREGRISGAVLKAIRQTNQLTQERLAELVGVDVSTLQGWESGRRPLMATPLGGYFKLRHLLHRLGAPHSLLTQLDTALAADRFIGYVLTSERPTFLDPHPLSTWVITRSFTELTTWPFTGHAPHALTAAAPLRRRGPSADGPTLAADERRHIVNRLRSAAEEADGDTLEGALLRRQAHYIVGFDESPDNTEWLVGIQRAEQRRLGSQMEWMPTWAAVRSGAHSLARTGDVDALPDFIDRHIRTDPCETANLNYWAYWLGEITEPQITDTFMINLNLESWHGGRLLKHLQERLTGENPYIDVVAHTLWALIMRKPDLLTEKATNDLADSITHTLDEGRASYQSCRELEEVFYALRMIHRRQRGHT